MLSASILGKPYRFILVSDLDWTMVDHDDPKDAALLAFNEVWQKNFAEDSLLVFSTGRSLELYSKLRKSHPLATPDVLVCSVGTEIFFQAEFEAPEPDAKWSTELDKGWKRQAIIDLAGKVPELQPQDASEQRPHKLSYHVSVKGPEAEKAVASLEKGLKEADISAKVIYSGGEDLDILPAQASKGKGLEFLLREIAEHGHKPSEGVMVCGDSGNDIELFAVPDVRGCMVVNAHPELKQYCDQHPSPNLFQASKRCAGGIVEALHHFKLIK